MVLFADALAFETRGLLYCLLVYRPILTWYYTAVSLDNAVTRVKNKA